MFLNKNCIQNNRKKLKIKSNCISYFSGWLYDVTQTYTASFILGGTLYLVAGVMCLMLRQAARCIFKDKEQA